MPHWSTLIIVFCFFSIRAPGQALTLAVGERYHIKTQLRHLRDPGGKLTFEQIKDNKDFVAEKSTNFGFDDAVHWFALDVDNKSDNSLWLFEVPFAALDEIDFYYPSATGWIHEVSGDDYPIRLRDIPYQHPLFKFELPPGSEARVFLRIKTTSSVQIPAVIWKPEAFYNRSFNLQIFNGVFYGAMMVMILYQLFLFLSTRDRVSLYYVFTLFAMIHVVSYYQGYGFLYLYPSLPQLNHYMAIVTGPVFLVFSTSLTRAFLNLRVKSPWIDKLLLVNMYADVLVGVLMLMNIGDISYRFHHYSILIHSLLALGAAGIGIYNKFRPALFYLLSWLTLLIATFLFSLSNLGIFREYLSTSSAGLIVACLLQMLFISFALGNRWNMMVKENHQAKEMELRRRLLENAELEELVRLRTEEIQHKNQKLEEVNRIKDKLFSVVSHDIKGPLTALQLALSLAKDNTISQKEFQELTNALETRFTQTTEFIENLLQWATVQLKGGNFQPAKFDFTELVRKTVSVFDFEIKNKNIILYNRVESPLYAFADVNMVRSVLRNLITNAIKFTRKGDTIIINADVDSSFISVSVSDTGIGIPLAHQKKLFSLDSVTTLGTKQEKGTGLGLLLSKEFIDRNGGEIWCESVEGKGTTFHFTIPVYVESEVPEPTR